MAKRIEFVITLWGVEGGRRSNPLSPTEEAPMGVYVVMCTINQLEKLHYGREVFL